MLTVNHIDGPCAICNNTYMPIDEKALYRQIGARIRQRRSEIDMTQDELAEAVGLLRTSIANMESGRQRAPVHVLYNVCSALGTEIEALLPSAQEISEQQMVQVRIDGVVKEVPPRTAELLQRLLEE